MKNGSNVGATEVNNALTSKHLTEHNVVVEDTAMPVVSRFFGITVAF